MVDRPRTDGVHLVANEKNRPPQHPGQNDPPPDKGPTRERETDSSGDPVDGTGEDNHQTKK
jgi:hypothetical protein